MVVVVKWLFYLLLTVLKTDVEKKKIKEKEAGKGPFNKDFLGESNQIHVTPIIAFL